MDSSGAVDQVEEVAQEKDVVAECEVAVGEEEAAEVEANVVEAGEEEGQVLI